MTYNVVVKNSKDGQYITLMSGTSLDYLPDEFRRECIRRVGKEIEGLLSPLKYHILNSSGEAEGIMVWVKAEGHEKPILMVSLKHRNTLMLYDVKGHLISKNSIQ